MKKLKNLFLIFALTTFVFLSTPLTAQAKDFIMHASTPTSSTTTDQKTAIHSQVINTSSSHQEVLVCAEALGAGKQWNLGCHRVSLNSFFTHKWGERMSVYLTDEMPQGQYSVFFTYQDQEGKWHELKSVETNQKARISVNKGYPLSQVQTTPTTTKKVTNDLRHSSVPKQVQAKKDIDPGNSVQTKVVNLKTESTKVLFCAEALGAGKNWHLGCIPEPISLEKVWNDQWGIDINVYARPDMPSSTYAVRYTYQDEAGKWHEIKNMNLSTSRTSLTI